MKKLGGLMVREELNTHFHTLYSRYWWNIQKIFIHAVKHEKKLYTT
jgi:hypothetical protein